MSESETQESDARSTAEVERESETCEECGEPIYFDEMGVFWKTSDERYRHEKCAPEAAEVC